MMEVPRPTRPICAGESRRAALRNPCCFAAHPGLSPSSCEKDELYQMCELRRVHVRMAILRSQWFDDLPQ
jgi:hypothetical protein